MESNSAPGKIHCSKEASELISEAGKSHWLTERPDRIVAKGKGSLVTFWLATEVRFLFGVGQVVSCHAKGLLSSILFSFAALLRVLSGLLYVNPWNYQLGRATT